MNYGLILIIAAYLGAVQLATKTKAGAVACTLLAVGLPFVISIVTQILLSNGAVQLNSLFTISSVATFALQFVVGLIVFKNLQNDDSIASVVGWAVGGFVVIVLLVPFVGQMIFR